MTLKIDKQKLREFQLAGDKLNTRLDELGLVRASALNDNIARTYAYRKATASPTVKLMGKVYIYRPIVDARTSHEYKDRRKFTILRDAEISYRLAQDAVFSFHYWANENGWVRARDCIRHGVPLDTMEAWIYSKKKAEYVVFEGYTYILLEHIESLRSNNAGK